MLETAKDWWERHGRSFQDFNKHPINILYGDATEDELQLIGSVEGKRVLELGCGGAQCSIAFAKRGALVTGVDFAESEIEFARELAWEHGVEIELFQRDMCDLSPIPSESQDVVFSASAFHYVDNLDVCFGEVYRVLKRQGIFAFGVGHPFTEIIDTETMVVNRSYFDTGVHIEGEDTDSPFAQVDRTISDYINLLVDAGLVVERMMEPGPSKGCAAGPCHPPKELMAKVPGTLAFKARKP